MCGHLTPLITLRTFSFIGCPQVRTRCRSASDGGGAVLSLLGDIPYKHGSADHAVTWDWSFDP
ncbi:hypothetical protein GDO78_022439 [Eleutherodactylus coqui]|uniref:Uncharacterized protein n=1 Tax=Eleutherodactylus coqui TaxID=57060 RepID=A0A8J6BI04_ELECQ|nr:hypothetical protein GDO78_022439 [Eleutherodactylus coqui]